MSRYQKKSFLKRLNKLVILAALLLVVAGWLGYRKFYQQANNTSPAPDSAETINYDPPTEEEKAETEAHKQQLTQQSTATTPSSSKKTVKPVITFAGQYDGFVEVGSYVSEVYEDGGTCTLTLTKGSQKVTRTAAGQKDVSKTLCPTFKVPVSEFPNSGTWAATVKYSSSSAEGTSDEKPVEVQK